MQRNRVKMNFSRLYYVVGDVHGALEQLRHAHGAIFHHWTQHHSDKRAVIVHLGDYIDRGPESRAVVDRLISLQQVADRRDDLDVVFLKGNHEQMLVDAVDDETAAARWLKSGGDATLASYAGVYDIDDRSVADIVDKDHVAWMRDLPSLIVDEENKLVFVHAGIQPRRFPHCPEDVRLWTRSKEFFQDDRWPANLRGYTVVHGHTPSEDGRPSFGPAGYRVGIDTGAGWGGPLTTAVFAPGKAVEFLVAESPAAIAAQ